ncbi:right-handed parallel beta-helix repeat-containing protein [Sorangium sp. So ce321]|uniref:right-handed parallel beta-helix repeat-containing protein n=1 Tax=Sorangium sp. So ce321 TaxID=3133300 RepID=UPI003F642E22
MAVLVAAPCALAAATAAAATLTVGPGKTHATPCQAIAAASDDDTIEIDAAGDYAGDVCGWSKNGLTLRGVGGLAKIDAAGKSSGGKAIWVIAGNDTVVEDIELTGAAVPDQNGAGIRQEGANLTVRGCFFHDNENGILAGDNAASTILIERSEFARNGAGDGQSHNLYINHVARLIFQHNYSHASNVGHLLKTRALENHVLYNRLTQEDGTGSYEIDVPSGGLTFIIGNLVQQGPDTGNGSIVAYRLESNGANANTELFVVNNTFVNERPNGGTFLNISSSAVPAVVRNNIFAGPGTLTNQGNASLGTSFQGDPMFVDQAAFDYRLQDGSPCIDEGEAPGMGGGIDLTPEFHYVHPAGSTGRTTVGTIDIGAYEVGGEGGSGGSGASGGAGGSGGASGASGGGAGGSGGASGSGGAGGGADGSGGAGGADDGGTDGGEEESCGCRVVGGGARGSFGWVAGLVIVAAVVARRDGRRVEISRR